MRVYFRHDDVLDISHPDPFPYYKKISEVFKEFGRPDQFIHIPTLVVEDIQTWPHAVAYLKAQVDAGEVFPQLHGYRHIHYDQLPLEEIVEHLSKSKKWMQRVLGVTPTVWYTPWGAEDENMKHAAETVGLSLQGVSRVLKTRDMLARLNKPKYYPFESINEQIVMFHWWDKDICNRLRNILEKLVIFTENPDN